MEIKPSGMMEGLLGEFPVSHVRIENKIVHASGYRHCKVIILPKGDGWMYTDRGEVAAQFFMEDILYRLDLQGKLP